MSYAPLSTNELPTESTVEQPEKTSASYVMAYIRKLFLTILKRIGSGVTYIFFRLWIPSNAFILSFILLSWSYHSWLAFCVVILSMCGYLYTLQDRLLFMPDEPPDSRLIVPLFSTRELNTLCTDVWMQTSDNVKIHGIFVRAAKKFQNSSRLPTVLFCHGNAGNVGYREEVARGYALMLGCNVFLLEYRGFGLSSGYPSEKGTFLDAQAALEYLHTCQNVDPTCVVVHGQSMGGAVAVQLVSRVSTAHVRALILQNTFTSIRDTAMALFPPVAFLIKRIPDFCFKNKYKSVDSIQKIMQPILFVSGTEDTLLPPRMMKTLFTECTSTRKQLALFQAGHNDTLGSTGYWERLLLFFKELQVNPL